MNVFNSKQLNKNDLFTSLFTFKSTVLWLQVPSLCHLEINEGIEREISTCFWQIYTLITAHTLAADCEIKMTVKVGNQ